MLKGQGLVTTGQSSRGHERAGDDDQDKAVVKEKSQMQSVEREQSKRDV